MQSYFSARVTTIFAAALILTFTTLANAGYAKDDSVEWIKLVGGAVILGVALYQVFWLVLLSWKGKVTAAIVNRKYTELHKGRHYYLEYSFVPTEHPTEKINGQGEARKNLWDQINEGTVIQIKYLPSNPKKTKFYALP